MKSKATKAKYQKPPPSEEVNALLALYNARRYAEAESRTRALLKKYPEFGFGWKLLGGAQQMQGKDALPAFRKVTELMPVDPEAHFNLGVVLKGAGRLQDAAASNQKAIELNPDDPYYPAGIAWAYAKDGNREQALVYIRRAEAAGVPLKEIGLVYGSLGDLDTAFDYLERGFEAEPGTLANIAADPSADPLRDDPRWDELLEKLARE